MGGRSWRRRRWILYDRHSWQPPFETNQYREETFGRRMEHILELPRGRVIPQLFGIHDANLRYIEEHLSVTIRAHENIVTIAGIAASVELAAKLLEGAYRLLEAGIRLDIGDLGFLASLIENGEELNPGTIRSERIAIHARKVL